jgi:acyl dehydratase
MALRLDLVGKTTAPTTYRATSRDTILYALGVGARTDEIDYLYEGRGPRVLPTFGVIPCFPALLQVTSDLSANPMMVLHGEQKVRLHRLIPPEGLFTTVCEVKAIYDKGKGALVLVEAHTRDETDTPLLTNEFSIFVRGEGGFGGERGPEPLRADPPEGVAPDFTVVETTTPEQAFLYRLSGDLNPLHVDPEAARRGGWGRPILHGLCTYGYAGRALLRHACGGDARKFVSFAARFAGVVYPGDTLTTHGWRLAPGRWAVQVLAEGKVVLSNALAEMALD